MGLTTRVCGKYSADTNMFDSQKGICKPIGRIYVPFALTNGTGNTDSIPLLSLHSAWQTQCREPWSPTLSMYWTENSFPVLAPHKIMDLTRMCITFLALVIFPAQPNAVLRDTESTPDYLRILISETFSISYIGTRSICILASSQVF